MELFSDLKNLILLPAILAWFALRGKRPKWATYLGIQLSLACFVELSGWLSTLYDLHNHWVYNIYMPLEFITLTLMIVHIQTPNKWISGLGYAACISSISLLLITVTLTAEGSVFAIIPMIVGGVLLALQAMIALYRIGEHAEEPLITLSEFWALSSILIYFLCFIPVLGLAVYYAERNQELAGDIFSVNDVLFVIRYGLATVAFLILRKQLRQTPC